MLEITARPGLRLRMLRWSNRAVLFISTLFLGEWALYGVFRCPFVVPFVSCQNCPVAACPGQISRMFLGFWMIWPAVALCFGRAFCGWLCPGALLNRVLGLNPVRFRENKVVADVFSRGKFFMLGAGLWTWLLLGQPRVNVPIRIGEFWPSVLLTYEHAFPMWQLRFGITVVMLALGIAALMSWCRFACPFGGVLELARRIAPFGFFKTSDCNQCDECRRTCVMRARPGEDNCVDCGDCVAACPQDCIRFGKKPSKTSGSGRV